VEISTIKKLKHLLTTISHKLKNGASALKTKKEIQL